MCLYEVYACIYMKLQKSLVIINEEFCILKLMVSFQCFRCSLRSVSESTLYCAVYIWESLIETHNSNEVIMYSQALKM